MRKKKRFLSFIVCSKVCISRVKHRPGSLRPFCTPCVPECLWRWGGHLSCVPYTAGIARLGVKHLPLCSPPVLLRILCFKQPKILMEARGMLTCVQTVSTNRACCLEGEAVCLSDPLPHNPCKDILRTFSADILCACSGWPHPSKGHFSFSLHLSFSLFGLLF